MIIILYCLDLSSLPSNKEILFSAFFPLVFCCCSFSYNDFYIFFLWSCVLFAFLQYYYYYYLREKTSDWSPSQFPMHFQRKTLNLTNQNSYHKPWTNKTAKPSYVYFSILINIFLRNWEENYVYKMLY